MEKACKNCKNGEKLFAGNVFCKTLGIYTNDSFNCSCFFELEKSEKGNTKQIVNQILIALQEAKEKHPDWPKDLPHQLLIMGEESGEAQKAALHIIEGKGTYNELKEELYQTAAMCIRILENL